MKTKQNNLPPYPASLSSKHVVLVNDHNIVLGTLDKNIAHHTETPLHRGFSVFLFNKSTNFLLLQKRSLLKTWPNFWSNSFCGHPQIHESNTDAILRHAKYELNITDLSNIEFVSDYKYKFGYDNIYENEICPIYIAYTTTIGLSPNKNEVSDTEWISWENFLNKTISKPEDLTPWCIEEARIIQEFLKLKTLI